ncbi:MAG: N-acetylmuramoyl-L-alanine amidase, partial [Porticoccaceae bacterium]
VDAGHGGDDPGALGPYGLHEKAVVLAISRNLKKLIDAEPGFRAILVRDGDYFIPLGKRSDIARQKGADMFVSVHADAFGDVRARGASVYALSREGATSETASYLAQRENRSDLIGGVGGVSLAGKDKMVASVLLDLSMTATLATSLEVGNCVLKSMGGIARLHRNRVEQAEFKVLKSPDLPSILVETGFISNHEESRRLGDPAYQRKMAAAIFSGIKGYFSAKPPAGTRLAALTGGGSSNVRVIASGDMLPTVANR